MNWLPGIGSLVGARKALEEVVKLLYDLLRQRRVRVHRRAVRMTVCERKVLRLAIRLARFAPSVLLLMQSVDVMHQVMEIVRETRREPQCVDYRVEEAP